MDLNDGVCVITGGASGIGAAMARRFAGAGMRVVIGDIEQQAIDAFIAAFPHRDRVLGVTCDVRSVDDVRRLRDESVGGFGDVDVLCLNAGVAPVSPIVTTPLDVWDWVYDVNVRGVINGLHVFGPAMVERGRGHIVCTASAAGLTDTPSMGAYGMTKHAVVGMAAALRKELAASGIGVSVLCPGFIDTNIFESERNRPEGMADPSLGNETSKMYRSMIHKHGASPDVAADFVYRGVLDDQFFVFPTTDTDPLFEARIADVRQGLEWRDKVQPQA